MMNKPERCFRPLSMLTTGSAVLLLAACGGGGGGGSSQAEITPDKVVATLDSIEEVVPTCSTTAQKASFVGTAKLMGDLLTVSRSLAVDQKQAQIKVQSKVSGSCSGTPGSATVSSEHENGVTEYQLVFANYCSQGPNGNAFYNGEVQAKEIGTPTDNGPLISELRMEAENLEVKPNGDVGDTLLVSVKGARTSYGNPSTWAPDAPTSDSPDQSSVDRVRITNTTRNEVHQLDNVELVRVGGNSATVDVTGGRYTNPEGETVSVGTPVGQPLQVNLGNGEVTGGMVELVGGNDTVAQITPVAGTLRVNINVNGEPLGTSLNCDNAEQQLGETINMLFQQLPIY